MSERKIDVYNHVMPRAVADRIRELAPGKGDMVKRVTSIPMLYDIEARIRMMDRWPAYQQVLTLSNPPIETIAGPGDTPELARVLGHERSVTKDLHGLEGRELVEEPAARRVHQHAIALQLEQAQDLDARVFVERSAGVPLEEFGDAGWRARERVSGAITMRCGRLKGPSR